MEFFRSRGPQKILSVLRWDIEYQWKSPMVFLPNQIGATKNRACAKLPFLFHPYFGKIIPK
jgi:hypothetical protein